MRLPCSPAWVLLCLFVAVAGVSATSDDPNRDLRLALQAELEDFSTPGWENAPPPHGAALVRYRGQLVQVAGDPLWTPVVRSGTIPLERSGEPPQKLGVNIFHPAGPARGTLLFVHGYMSHAANFAYTFREFTRLGWTVITLDLPGHGMSTGPRADITSFAAYGDAVQQWLEWVNRGTWQGPRVLLAHSLGAAAAFEALRRPETIRPETILFCAPLLRPDWYPVLAVGEKALGWWVKTMPSSFGWDGYLDGYTMPVAWFAALGRWLDALPNQKPLDLPLTIYSGDRDEVVDEGWNREAFRRLVPSARYVVLPNEGHLFLTETRSRQAAQALLVATLGITPLPPSE